MSASSSPALDTSGLTFYVTSDNFSGSGQSSAEAAADDASPAAFSSSSPPSASTSLSPAVAAFQLQLAEQVQSFTSTFLSAQPNISAADRQAILSLSTALHPAPPPPPPRRVRAYIDGCYDVLHSGHYNAIRQAKSLCDELVLGIHTDAEILHHKGPTVMSDEERVSAVRACKWIDQVVFGVPYDPSVELLDALGCEFCVHGDDQSVTATGEDAFAKVKKVGRMRIVKRTEGISTTDIVGRLLAMGRQKAARKGAAAAAASGQQSSALSSPRVSTFLPLSFRISQFCNNRTPRPTDRVVYIAGDFDLFHVAHIDMLHRARQLGSFLYVGVYDDIECERLKGREGAGHPVMSMFERVLCVLACRWVDEVVIGVKRSVSVDMMKSLNIHVVVDSEESERRRVRGKQQQTEQGQAGGAVAVQAGEEAVLQNGVVGEDEDDGYAAVKQAGAYRVLELERDLSTDAVVDRILLNQDKYEKRNSKRSGRETEYLTQKEYVEERRNRS